MLRLFTGIVLILLLTLQTVSSQDCWWTGCQLSSWAATGCEQYDRIARSTRECQGGTEYECCLAEVTSTATPITTTTTTTAVPDPRRDCWWSGCQPDTWAVRGCSQYNRTSLETFTCVGGMRYHCCKEDVLTTAAPKIDPDQEIDSITGLTYLNLAKFLISQNPNFASPERLSCNLLDPSKNFYMQIGNYGMPICDLCPNFNQLIYTSRLLNQDPLSLSYGLEFPDCFASCADNIFCVAFSHDRLTKTCYHFNSTQADMSHETGYSTVIMTQPTGMAGQWTYSRNTQFFGASKLNSSQESFQDCLLACEKNVKIECKGISYHFQSQACEQYFSTEETQSHFVYGYASALRLSSMSPPPNEDVNWRFDLINEDQLHEAIDKAGIKQAGECSHINGSIGSFYHPPCKLNDYLGCLPGTSCKSCYYPEKSQRTHAGLEICPDSYSVKYPAIMKRIGSQLEACLEKSNCLGVIFDQLHFNPIFLNVSNINLVTNNSIAYVIKFPLGHSELDPLSSYDLLPSYKLKKWKSQNSADFLEMSSDSLSNCIQLCNGMESCNRFSYSGLAKNCKLSSADGLILSEENGWNELVGVKERPINFRGRRFVEIPGFKVELASAQEYLVGERECYQNCQKSCEDECSGMGNCTTIVMSEKGTRISCQFYRSDNLTLENARDARILQRVKSINITQEFLDQLPIFQESDVFNCYDKNGNLQSQSSLDIGLNDKLHIRSRRGFFDSIGKFFKKIGETVVNTVKGVVEDIGNVVKSGVALITGDVKKAKESIQKVGIVNDVINVGKSVGKLFQGDLEGAKDAFLDTSIGDNIKTVGDIGGALIKGDFDTLLEKTAELGTTAILRVPGGRKKGGKRKVSDEVNHSKNDHNRRKRDVDKDKSKEQEKKNNENRKESCKRKRSKRSTGRKSPSSKNKNDDCDDDDFCPPLKFPKLLQTRTQKTQCERIKAGQHCDFECEQGHDEEPDYRLKCIKKGNNLEWDRRNLKCEKETCNVDGIPGLVVMKTPKPKPLLASAAGLRRTAKVTALVVLFDKSRKIPFWSIALHESSQFGRKDYSALPLSESAGRHNSFLKHPCLQLKTSQANDNAYRNEPWEKGHLTPAKAVRWSAKASRSVNSFLNVAPQDATVNKEVWKFIESHTLCAAEKTRSIIATGTCLKTLATMNGVGVPSCFWKMICYVDEDGNHQVVGFISDNSKLAKDPAQIKKRRWSAYTPRSQLDVTLHAGIAANPFLTSARHVASGHEVLSVGTGPELISTVNPLACAKAQILPKEVAEKWEEVMDPGGLDEGMQAVIEGLKKLSLSGGGKKRKRNKRAVKGCACCTKDELKSFIGTFFGPSDKTEEGADDDDEDNGEESEEEIDSTESLVPATSCGKRIVGYFTSWGKKKFSPRMAQRLSHVIFAFFETKESGQVEIGCVDPANSADCGKDEELARARLSQMQQVAFHFDHLNVMFAIGGWENSQYFSAIAASREKRLVLIGSIIRAIKKYEFDGVDIDWEYPVTGGAHEGISEDKQNYVTLLSELRTALDNLAKIAGRDKPYLISLAGAAGQWTLDPGYDLKGILKHVDFINVMTYDYFGAWSSKWGAYTGPPAPLYYGMPKGFSGKTNVAWTIKYYACKGNQPHKINMGVPFYARFWENVGNAVEETDGMWRVAEKSDGQFKGGAYTWNEVKSKLTEPGYQPHFHEKSKSKYTYNPTTRIYLGLEDPETLQHKVDFAIEKNVGGIMIWALDQDDDELSMLDTVYNAELCRNSNPSDVPFKCIPTDEVLWWTPENSDEDTQGKCGMLAPLVSGRYPACDPDDPGYNCCSSGGYCGSGKEHCECKTCVNHGANPEKILEHARVATEDEIKFRNSCKKNWENGCVAALDCCSKNCFKGENNDWVSGQCKPES